MKTLQSLNQKQNLLLAKFLKLSILITLTSLTACASNKQSMVDYEPCSVADSVKPMSDSDFNQAFAACKARALGGDPVSQKNLAYIYYFGNGHVQKDVAEGTRWFNAAAAQGNAAATARLQDMNTKMVSYNYAQ